MNNASLSIFPPNFPLAKCTWIQLQLSLSISFPLSRIFSAIHGKTLIIRANFSARSYKVGMKDHTDSRTGEIPQSTIRGNWTITVPDVRTVQVSNISLAAAERDINHFFSFSGEIQYVQMLRESETTQLAYVTFKDSQGADTALLLTGATIADLSVTITPAENYKLPPGVLPLHKENEANSSSAVKKAEDVVSSMLAKGFVLGKDALNKAKSFDERIHLTSNASATVSNIDRKVGLSEKLSFGTSMVSDKVRAMDERFHVSEITKSAFGAAEQTASSARSAIMGNHYVSVGASWISSAFSAVAKAAEDVSTMTKNKVGKVEDEKREIMYKERTDIVNNFAQLHLDESYAAEPPMMVQINSEYDSKLNNF